MRTEIEWQQIANDRIFPGFKEFFCYHYYLHGGTLDFVLAIVQASQPMVTREVLVVKCRMMDLPLRKSDEGG